METSKVKLERLERQLPKGKSHFILMWGVLFWAVPVAILTKMLLHFLGERTFFDGLIPWLIWLIVFSVCGIFYGRWLWSYQNKKYQEAKTENARQK